MILGVGTDLANIERIERTLTRFGDRMGIAWKDMAVTNLRTGQPVMQVTGWAKERLEQMTPEGYQAIIHVTLTDDHPWAQAFVVIEALPADEAAKLRAPPPKGRPLA